MAPQSNSNEGFIVKNKLYYLVVLDLISLVLNLKSDWLELYAQKGEGYGLGQGSDKPMGQMFSSSKLFLHLLTQNCSQSFWVNILCVQSGPQIYNIHAINSEAQFVKLTGNGWLCYQNGT